MFLTASLLLALPAAEPVTQTPVALAPSADGKLLYVVMRGGAPTANAWLCVWDLAKPELRAVVPGLPPNVTSVTGSADGSRAVVLVGDRWHATSAEVWSVADKKRLRALEPPGGYGAHMAVSRDAGTIAARAFRDAKTVRVWSASTGEELADVQKAASATDGHFAFTTDSKKLVVASRAGYAEYDLATGKKGTAWTAPKHDRTALEREWRAIPSADGRAVLVIGGTGKRFVSDYAVLVTEKAEHNLGEFRHSVGPAAFAPNGKRLVLCQQMGNETTTFALELEADGKPELLKEPDPRKPKWETGNIADGPAWRSWALGESTRAGYEPPVALAFSPDGARVFAANRLGRTTVHDPATRKSVADLFVAWLPKEGAPEWHIVTPAREAVGSAGEIAALEKSGFKADAVKVRAALGAK